MPSSGAVADVVWKNGAFLDGAAWELDDRGALLGDAVFETVRARGGAPEALDAHLARLAHGASVLGIAASLGGVGDVVRAAVTRLGAADAAVRITLTRGPGPRGLGPDGFATPALVVRAQPYTPPPAWAYADGVDVRTVTARRIPPSVLPPTIKHANALPAILGRRELVGPRELEGIVLAVDGTVACGLASNLFAVIGGRLVTPPLSTGALAGITRARVIARAGAVEEPLTPAALAAADEAFLTSSLVGVLPIARVDGVALRAAPGSVTASVSPLD